MNGYQLLTENPPKEFLFCRELPDTGRRIHRLNFFSREYQLPNEETRGMVFPP
jgi:hypothetical protein